MAAQTGHHQKIFDHKFNPIGMMDDSIYGLLGIMGQIDLLLG
nr:hypothetical protein [Sphingobacterium mizutaii]